VPASTSLRRSRDRGRLPSGADSSRMRRASDGRNCTQSCPYDVVLVDEVGAATVPEVLLAVAKATETAVLFGDVLQLRAVTDKGAAPPGDQYRSERCLIRST
jgi:hypothetical protein